MSDKTWYIYAHYALDTDECFYIGVGTGQRALSKQGRNQYWSNIVKKHDYRVEIIADDFLDRNVAIDKEIMLQLLFKPRACLTYGDRCNAIVSAKTKRKISLAGKKRQPVKHTKETRTAMSIDKSKSVINCRGEIFKSALEAGRIIGISNSNINCNIKGYRLSAGKYEDGAKTRWFRHG